MTTMQDVETAIGEAHHASRRAIRRDRRGQLRLVREDASRHQACAATEAASSARLTVEVPCFITTMPPA